MKLRTLLAGLVVVVALPACGALPTSADIALPSLDDVPTDTVQTDTTGRSGKPMGSGS